VEGAGSAGGRIVSTMADGLNPALKAVSDAVLAIGAQQSTEDVLQELVHSARALVGARYAALGVPDEEEGFSAFLTSGMSDKLIASLGPLPHSHGMLGAILEAPTSFRTPDIHDDPRFKGFWPRGHPDMRSFLGVPIVAPEGVIGAFYLTEKESGPEFTPADQELIELLAAHAAIAITHARLHERSRELTVLEERNRLALELHDAVSQKLFGLVLNAEAAVTLLDRDADAARGHVLKLQQISKQALDELRSLIFELRPPDLVRDGLCGALRKHVEVLRRVQTVELDMEGDFELAADPRRDAEVFRIAQEATQNALRHARATRVVIRLSAQNGHLQLDVADDGIGFDPQAAKARARRLGLTSMEERAGRIGGRLEIRSSDGAGTTVHLDV
jgi:signal transduction histidine kinase